MAVENPVSGAVLVLGGPAGLPGSPGADSTVPGPAGADSTVPGPPGQPGPGTLATRTATTNIAPSTYVVDQPGGMCAVADPTNPAHRGKVLGLVITGVGAGLTATIQYLGSMSGVSGTFTPGDALYIGDGTTGRLGSIVNVPPPSSPTIEVWRQQVGTATTTSLINGALGPAYRVPATNGAALVVPQGGFAPPASTADVAAGTAAGLWVSPAALKSALAAPQSEKPAIVTALPTAVPIGQDGLVNVAWVKGIDLTGAQDVTASVQACLNAIAASPNGGTLYIPAGAALMIGTGSASDPGLTYRADKPLTITGGGSRRGSQIIQNCATLFTLASSNPQAATSSNQDLRRQAFFLTINYAGGVAFDMQSPEAVRASDFRAAAGAGYWSTFFQGLNIRTSKFENGYIRNDHGLGTKADVKGIFTSLASTAGSTDNRFADFTIQGFDAAIYAVFNSSPGVEGLILRGLAIVACNKGVVYAYNGPAGYVPPQLQFTGGHMNCFETWVQASNVAQVHIAESELELSSAFGDVQSPIVLTGVNAAFIHDNNLGYTNGSRGASPIVVGAGCVRVKIHDNGGVVQGAPNFVQILSGAVNTSVHDNEAYGVTGAMVGDAGTFTVQHDNRILQ